MPLRFLLFGHRLAGTAGRRMKLENYISKTIGAPQHIGSDGKWPQLPKRAKPGRLTPIFAAASPMSARRRVRRSRAGAAGCGRLPRQSIRAETAGAIAE